MVNASYYTKSLRHQPWVVIWKAHMYKWSQTCIESLAKPIWMSLAHKEMPYMKANEEPITIESAWETQDCPMVWRSTLEFEQD